VKRREVLMSGGAVAVASSASGCATLLDLLQGALKTPDVAIKGMKITKMSLSSVATRFDAEINNPNPFGIRLDGLDWGLKLGGKSFVDGLLPKGLELKARGKSDTQLDIAFDLGKTAQAILDLIESKIIDYEIETKSHFRVRTLKLDVPANFKGKMPLPDVPNVQVKSFDLKNASASGLNFRMLSRVSNPNSFELPIDGLSFDVKLGGRSVLLNKLVRGVRVAAKQTEEIPIDFQVELVQLGMSLIELASSPKVKWEVASEVMSGPLKLPFNQAGVLALRR
jgi:LEA14-like dessication related protein